MKTKENINSRLPHEALKLSKKNRRGFTLVELMIVVVIMVILAAAATPIFKGYVERAKLAKYYEEMHQVIQAGEVATTDILDVQGLNANKDKEGGFWYPLSGPNADHPVDIAFANALNTYLDPDIANRTTYSYRLELTTSKPTIMVYLYLKERYSGPFLSYKVINGEPGEITYNPGK